MTARSEQLIGWISERIFAVAKRLKEEGYKQDEFAMASGVVLSQHLAQALERIETLEDDIKALTDMVAGLESKQ